MKLTVDMDGLTWGELFAFTDAARAAGMQPDAPVQQVFASQDEEILVELSVEVGALNGRVAVLKPADRAELIDVIGQIIDSDGDARAVVLHLEGIRDLLI